jgi:acetyl-CoA synthetase
LSSPPFFFFFVPAPAPPLIIIHPPPKHPKKTKNRELTLVPPLLGSSQHLLNRDHFATYYAGMPRCLPPTATVAASSSSSSSQPFAAAAAGPPSGLAGRRLRRHGDEFARLPGGYYQALGRVDDTMNLGGIKVSSAELERCVLERVAIVGEAAAVGVPSPGGGPERLVLFVVLTSALPSSSSSSSSSSGGGGAGDSDSHSNNAELEELCRQAVRQGLNPLFRVQRVVAVAALPRTASGKVVRRALRDQAAAAGRL